MQVYERLEQELIPWTGAPHVAVCSTGTAALHLALESLHLPRGSEVIVPEFTFVAVARAVVLAGLTPVFVDCDENGLMNLDHHTRTDRVEAVTAVHTYGRKLDMRKLGKQYPHFFIVEDMAELHGDRMSSEADVACWSFYANKVLAAEEGGCVASGASTLIKECRSLRSQGYTGGGEWVHAPRGMNYRMTNAQAGLLSGRLPMFNEIVAKRRLMEVAYDQFCPEEWRMPARLSPWMYDFRVNGMSKEHQLAAVKVLQGLGVAARCGFRPMTLQEEFRGHYTTGRSMAERLSREMIYLPLDFKGSRGEVFDEMVHAKQVFDMLKTIIW